MAPDLSYDNTLSERLNFLGNEMNIKLVANIFYLNSSRFRSFPVSKFQILFRFIFLDYYNSSSNSLKMTTDNSSSRFNFRNENYTGLESQWNSVLLDALLCIARHCSSRLLEGRRSLYMA